MTWVLPPRWLAIAFGLAVVIGASGASAVAAHAVLLRSTPSSRQTLSEAPGQVTLLFSEPIDPRFSSVRVLNQTGQRVDRADAHVDATDDHLLLASLQPGLADGVYTVSWRSLSTIDVHPDGGEFNLFVRVPVVSNTLSPRGNRVLDQTTATPETTIGRWWFYVSASLFGGVLAAWKVVLSSILVARDGPVRAVVRGRLQRLIVLGGILLVIGTVYTALAQAAAAADVPLLSSFGQPLSDLLLRGRFASIWWPRVGLEIASLLLIAFGGLEGMAADCALAMLPAVLLTSSLTSHGAAFSTGPGLGIAIDWLHILGAAAWVGGLFSLAVVLPQVRRSATADLSPRLVARFGRFALLSAGVVFLSGCLQAAFELGGWAALVGTAYGQLVLVKLALLITMGLLAAFNEWYGRRTTAQGTGQLLGLRRGIRAELVVGVVALGVAAVLSGTPPNRAELVPPAVASQRATTP